MENNLHRIEKGLRSIAKRYKSVKYSIGLAILFLMLGVSAFSEEVNTKAQVAQIATREELKNIFSKDIEIEKIKFISGRAKFTPARAVEPTNLLINIPSIIV